MAESLQRGIQAVPETGRSLIIRPRRKAVDWLRTPNAGNANNVRICNTGNGGGLNNNNANNSNGLGPIGRTARFEYLRGKQCISLKERFS